MVKKILIIDNDADFSEACRNFLEAAGYEVLYEQKEADALRRAKEYAPDAILLDIVMDTQESGFAIAGALYALEATREIPIIFLTGYFMQGGLLDKEKEITKKFPNVRQILDKPVKPAMLLEAIRKL